MTTVSKRKLTAMSRKYRWSALGRGDDYAGLSKVRVCMQCDAHDDCKVQIQYYPHYRVLTTGYENHMAVRYTDKA